MKRREILKNLRVLPLIERIASAGIPPQSVMTATKVAKCNLFAEIGLRTLINATGNHVVTAGVLIGISWNKGNQGNKIGKKLQFSNPSIFYRSNFLGI